jgi:hypothetical protein
VEGKIMIREQMGKESERGKGGGKEVGGKRVIEGKERR